MNEDDDERKPSALEASLIAGSRGQKRQYHGDESNDPSSGDSEGSADTGADYEEPTAEKPSLAASKKKSKAKSAKTSKDSGSKGVKRPGESKRQGESKKERRQRLNRASAKKKRAKKMMELEFFQEEQSRLTDANISLRNDNESLRERIAMVKKYIPDKSSQPSAGVTVAASSNVQQSQAPVAAPPNEFVPPQNPIWNSQPQSTAAAAAAAAAPVFLQQLLHEQTASQTLLRTDPRNTIPQQPTVRPGEAGTGINNASTLDTQTLNELLRTIQSPLSPPIQSVVVGQHATGITPEDYIAQIQQLIGGAREAGGEAKMDPESSTGPSQATGMPSAGYTAQIQQLIGGTREAGGEAKMGDSMMDPESSAGPNLYSILSRLDRSGASSRLTNSASVQMLERIAGADTRAENQTPTGEGANSLMALLQQLVGEVAAERQESQHNQDQSLGRSNVRVAAENPLTQIARLLGNTQMRSPAPDRSEAPNVNLGTLASLLSAHSNAHSDQGPGTQQRSTTVDSISSSANNGMAATQLRGEAPLEVNPLEQLVMEAHRGQLAASQGRQAQQQDVSVTNALRLLHSQGGPNNQLSQIFLQQELQQQQLRQRQQHQQQQQQQFQQQFMQQQQQEQQFMQQQQLIQEQRHQQQLIQRQRQQHQDQQTELQLRQQLELLQRMQGGQQFQGSQRELAPQMQQQLTSPQEDQLQVLLGGLHQGQLESLLSGSSSGHVSASAAITAQAATQGRAEPPSDNLVAALRQILSGSQNPPPQRGPW